MQLKNFTLTFNLSIVIFAFLLLNACNSTENPVVTEQQKTIETPPPPPPPAPKASPAIQKDAEKLAGILCESEKEGIKALNADNVESALTTANLLRKEYEELKRKLKDKYQKEGKSEVFRSAFRKAVKDCGGDTKLMN